MSALIHYRRFTEEDIAAAHALTVELKWPHRVEDWRFVTGIGTGFAAVEGATLVGTALCWKYGSQTASLGMVIVAPSHQGRGIGRRLTELALEELGSRGTMLHATPAGRPLYEQLGFRAIGALDQHQGAALQPALVSLPPAERLRPLGASDLPRLVELASRTSGLDRAEVLPALLETADGIGLDRDGELIGFALFRRFGRGRAIGPVVAPKTDDPFRAKALIGHWLACNPGMFVRIDVPAEAGLTDWLEALGLSRVDHVAKMARNGDRIALHDDTYAQYGIINQAIC
ncbi:GNAT family N-acetyltransferase [Trinickia caryophylli]|uniref:Predicted N-acetyltransferase YhbS n=1 Tax=Trinickia caryophylli TaxID=28094 RepID=A0A1X7D218_TRICW|nr:GNAT family N-acetyltransferase [Trinickia caryophylli]PMS12811.1 GNAT family N-acetyltransferase [Trinickia caryophylli]TRX15229.1 GNAT family N-acetyltransferase [Trinickia caryophylli]WQE15102.1 GNAT family N-acetyltransferase [Trinickia caryophylli]SMF07262.1 Predicted N-acetyltransferase YhbS [Trinickia caryophylli]GLU31162.1 N-acetyltransferase [Trinickia caryophylli]